MEDVVYRVRRDWVIRRLRCYQQQTEAIKIIQATYSGLIREIDGIKSPTLDDMPHGSEMSDRTYQQAARMPRLWRRLEELEQEMDAIREDMREIDNALTFLNPTERFVIEARYTRPVSRKQYRVLAREQGFAESTLKNAHTSALKKLVEIL